MKKLTLQEAKDLIIAQLEREGAEDGGDEGVNADNRKEAEDAIELVKEAEDFDTLWDSLVEDIYYDHINIFKALIENGK
jgi:hypothetical protein